MKRILVVDIEANGLLDTVDKIWCIVVKYLNEDKWIFYTNQKVPREMYDIIDPNRTFGLEAFNLWGIREDMKDVEFIMHNGILYDMPTLDKVLGFNSEKKGIKIQDTYRMSQTLWPDMPGGHSVENWLKKLKGPNQKVQNEQWTEWDPIMIQRCKSDVLGTEEIYNELLRETEQRKQYV